MKSRRHVCIGQALLDRPCTAGQSLGWSVVLEVVLSRNPRGILCRQACSTFIT